MKSTSLERGSRPRRASVRTTAVSSGAALAALATALLALYLVPGCGTDSGGPRAEFDGGPDPIDATIDDGSSGTFGTPVNPNCKKRTCEEAGANCGPVADGCGGLIENCGTCAPGTVCGGGGTPSVCGTDVNGGAGCIPLTCEKAGANCGPAGDGCGGVIQCGTCSGNETCGGGGTPSVCGIAYEGPVGDGGTCVPRKCEDVGANCGPVADGCGGLLQCGDCRAPEICGGAGRPNVCGNPFAQDGSACKPLTCQDVGANCGPIGDGCGGVVQCGTCQGSLICGGGGRPSVCGNPFATDGGAACKPRTCQEVGANCGPVADGCGGLLQCGSCQAPFLCGGDGRPNVCGNRFADDAGVVCRPKTCQELGANCGPAGDGCGGVVQCGTCIAPDICGGAGPSRCGGGTGGGGGGGTDAGGGGSCNTPLCNQIPACASGATTTLRGTVYAPNGQEPLYNALVYVPREGTVPAFSTALTCDRCNARQANSAIASAVTGPDGRFELRGVPAGQNVPLVIELGRWRRFAVLPNVSACVVNPIGVQYTRFPRRQAEGHPRDNIPRMAVATGDVDALECVLRKIGIDDSEFTAPTSAGRIHLYIANGQRPTPSQFTAKRDDLVRNVATLRQYDAVMLACEGNRLPPATSTWRTNLETYANAGGRIFATHYEDTWVSGGAWSNVARWTPNNRMLFEDSIPNGPVRDIGPLRSFVDTSLDKGRAFADWLRIVGALEVSAPPQVDIYYPRRNVEDDGVKRASQRWIYSETPLKTVQHMTWNTPVNAAANALCGRVLFSDFHVTNASNASKVFPAGCSAGPLTAQEKILEFMIFDLASCVQDEENPDTTPPPTCTPRTCQAAGAQCGPVADGCGGLLQCGDCPPGQTCGGGGVAYQCGGPSCTRLTCAQQGFNCGQAGDGCGGLLSCGTCPPGQTCGGGGTPGVCGGPTCTKRTCAQANATCGFVADGCGGLLQCGDCPPGQTCGGGGVPNQCGGPNCRKLTCADVNATCGPIGDGCGGTVDCGPCPPGQTCGGGGVPSQCGSPTPRPCQKRKCEDIGATCGPIADGCGGLVDCGPCVPPDTCGGGGEPNQCGSPRCKPRTCAELGYTCGLAADGCGGKLDCGGCAPPGRCEDHECRGGAPR
jgi:hypothetical protein